MGALPRDDAGPLRVAIDASALRAGRSGIGVYVDQLLAALPAAGVLPLPFSNRPVPGWPRAGRLPLRPTALWSGLVAEAQAGWQGAALVHYPTGRAPGSARWPRVVTVHDLWPFEAGALLSRRERWLTLPGLRQGILTADRIIAVSQDTASALDRRFPGRSERVVVVPEGPSLDPQQATWSLEELRERLQLSAGQPYWLHVGTLEPRKGLDTVVMGAAAAREELRRAGCPLSQLPALVLAGADGGRSKALRRLAAEHGLSDGLKLLGFVPQALLASLYREAAAYVALSLHEGFGLAALDALVFGLPLISSGAGALHTLAGPDGALRVPAGDHVALATALLALRQDPRLAHGLAEAGRRAAGRYSWSRCAQATAEVYRAAAGRNLSRPSRAGLSIPC